MTREAEKRDGTSAAVNAMPRLCGRWSGLEAEPEATGAPRCQVTMHKTREQTHIDWSGETRGRSRDESRSGEGMGPPMVQAAAEIETHGRPIAHMDDLQMICKGAISEM